MIFSQLSQAFLLVIAFLHPIHHHKLELKVPAVLLTQCAEDHARNKQEQSYHHHNTADYKCGEALNQSCRKVVHPHGNEEKY